MFCNECLKRMEAEDKRKEAEKQKELEARRVTFEKFYNRLCSYWPEGYEIKADRDRDGNYSHYISCLPDKFRNFNNIEIKDKLLVSKLTTQSAYLWGAPGTGKTMLAIAIYHIMFPKHEARFISYPSFIMHLQANYDESMERIDEITHSNRLLIVDDFGAQKMTDYVAQVTYYLINERDMNNRHTIFTSNYSLESIDKIIDGRVSSRIIGMCQMGDNIIEFSGKDRRIRA